MSRSIRILAPLRHAMLAFLLASSPQIALAFPTPFWFSTADDETVDTTAVFEEDIFEYNANLPAGNGVVDAKSFDGVANLSAGADVNAMYRYGTNRFLLSTLADATIDSTSVGAEDVWEWNGNKPVGQRVTIVIDGSTLAGFGASGDIDAIHLLPDGTFYLSTSSTATIDGTTFQDEDVVRYDPSAAASNQVTIVFDGSAFSFTGDTDGVTVEPRSGDLLMSIEEVSATIDGTTVLDGDVFEFVGSNPAGSRVTVFLAESALRATPLNLNALHLGVPEPTTLVLTILSLMGLAARRPKRSFRR